MKTGGKIRGKHAEYMIWNKPKRSYLMMQDISKLMLECYELQRMTKSQESKDAYGYVITALHYIIHKDY